MNYYELNNIQISKILEKDTYTKNIFLGVFSIDSLPVPLYPSCFVINTATSYEEGEHWLAIYYGKNRTATFFDSYGNHPEKFCLEHYMDRTAIKWNFNKKQLQSFESNICGYYCVLFLKMKSRSVELDEFLNLFTNDSKKNDMIIKNLILKNI